MSVVENSFNCNTIYFKLFVIDFFKHKYIKSSLRDSDLYEIWFADVERVKN